MLTEAKEINVMPSPAQNSSESDKIVSEPSDPAAPDDQWISMHYERIFNAAWMMSGDPWEAEDLAQETFVVAMDRWDTFGGRSTRATWLYGILLRLNRRRWRSASRMKRRIETYIRRNERAEPDNPADAFATSQWQQSLWSTVASLPPKQREAIVLRFAQDLSYAEIAEAIGCAEGTAKTRVHHGLKKLKNMGVEELTPDLNEQIVELNPSK